MPSQHMLHTMREWETTVRILSFGSSSSLNPLILKHRKLVVRAKFLDAWTLSLLMLVGPIDRIGPVQTSSGPGGNEVMLHF